MYTVVITLAIEMSDKELVECLRNKEDLSKHIRYNHMAKINQQNPFDMSKIKKQVIDGDTWCLKASADKQI
tara:strand:- start:914 stop:1126 length:213 start_codon:yes stop_codon:yes gene_type:complete